MEEIVFPPLPTTRELQSDLYQQTSKMLQAWRANKDAYMTNYVMLGRWGEHPRDPNLQAWMAKLTYPPKFDDPDQRLPDPRNVFPVFEVVCDYLPPNQVWHCEERLRHLREDAINHNFDPRKLALEVQQAVYDLFSLPQGLIDRINKSRNSDEQALPPADARQQSNSAAHSEPYAPIEQQPDNVTEIVSESEIPAEFRDGGKPNGLPLYTSVLSNPEKYGLNGPYLAKYYKGPRLRVGRRYIYRHKEIAALSDSKSHSDAGH